MHAQQFAYAVLSKYTEASEDERSSLLPVVRSLDLAFPQHMDAAVNELLRRSQEGEQARAVEVSQTLHRALAGSAHAPLPSAHSTLALAVDSPSAELRIAVGSRAFHAWNGTP